MPDGITIMYYLKKKITGAEVEHKTIEKLLTWYKCQNSEEKQKFTKQYTENQRLGSIQR